MTDNPFDSLGGFDMSALLQQAQQLQEQLQDAQERLAEATVDGEVGGGAVVVSVSGVGELVGIKIRTGIVDGNDDESLVDLADLIVAAYRDAKTQADALAAESMGPLTGGLGGPGQIGGPEAAGGASSAGPAGFGLPPGLGG